MKVTFEDAQQAVASMKQLMEVLTFTDRDDATRQVRELMRENFGGQAPDSLIDTIVRPMTQVYDLMQAYPTADVDTIAQKLCEALASIAPPTKHALAEMSRALFMADAERIISNRVDMSEVNEAELDEKLSSLSLPMRQSVRNLAKKAEFKDEGVIAASVAELNQLMKNLMFSKEDVRSLLDKHMTEEAMPNWFTILSASVESEPAAKTSATPRA